MDVTPQYAPPQAPYSDARSLGTKLGNTGEYLSAEDVKKIQDSIKALGDGKDPELKFSVEWPGTVVVIISGLSLIGLKKFMEKLAEHIEGKFWELINGKRKDDEEKTTDYTLSEAAQDFADFKAHLAHSVATIGPIIRAKTIYRPIIRYQFSGYPDECALEIVVPPSTIDTVILDRQIEYAVKTLSLKIKFGNTMEGHARRLQAIVSGIARRHEVTKST